MPARSATWYTDSGVAPWSAGSSRALERIWRMRAWLLARGRRLGVAGLGLVIGLFEASTAADANRRGGRPAARGPAARRYADTSCTQGPRSSVRTRPVRF